MATHSGLGRSATSKGDWMASGAIPITGGLHRHLTALPAELQSLVDLFNEDTINSLQVVIGDQTLTGEASTPVGFKQLMAAAILETMQTTGLDTDGRPLTVTSLSTADFSRTFTDPVTAQKLNERRASTLRAQARQIIASG